MILSKIGALLLAGAWGFVEGHVVEPSWGRFLATAGCGVLLLLVGGPRAAPGQRAGNRLARAATIAGCCTALGIVVPQLLSRVHVIPGAARVAAALLAAAGLKGAADDGGALLLETHAGAVGVALTWELAALPAILRCIVALVALEGLERLPRIALGAGAWGAFRLLVIAAARGEGLDEPWLREPALVLFTMLPLALMGSRAPRAPSAASQRTLAPARFFLGALAAGSCLGFWFYFHDPGPRAGGRVLIDESHSDWEPTDGPFDADHHGQRSLYNYALWRRWIEAHYPTRVAKTPLGEGDLNSSDVVVIKTPTRPYDAASIRVLSRFVHDGGGLLLVGDHTNLFGMSTILNTIASRFGVTFAHDDTFPLDHTRPDVHRPGPWVRHPVLRGIESYPFETSCSLGASWRADPIVIGRRLGAEPADYGHMNFFGNIALDADEPFGLFVQAAVVDCGAGRVAAFSDSTNFSNFSMLWTGRRALTLNLIDWLDRRPGSAARRALPAFIMIAGAALLALIGRAARQAAAGVVALGIWTALLGFAVAGVAASRAGIALAGEVGPIAPIRRVAFDRSLGSFEPSAVSAVFDRQEPALDEHHAFFIDTARAGLWPEVTDDVQVAAREADAIVVINPDRSPTQSEQGVLAAFVRRGGKLLVIDSVLNRSEASAEILRSFGIEIRTVLAPSADPRGAPAVPRLDVAADGGWSRAPLDAGVMSWRKDVGPGRIVLAIDGAVFSDRGLGGIYVNPAAIEMDRRRAQATLLRLLMTGV